MIALPRIDEYRRRSKPRLRWSHEQQRWVGLGALRAMFDSMHRRVRRL